MSKAYKSEFFSQKRVDVEMLREMLSKHSFYGSLSEKNQHQMVLVSDSHLKALMSLYVKRGELLSSSSCILCCAVPKKVSAKFDYYLNRQFSFVRIFQKFFDFIVHSFKPLPKRLYSSLEEEHFVNFDMGCALGGVLSQLVDTGLAYQLMLDIDRDRLSKILKVPSRFKLVALVCIAYPLGEGEDRSSLGVHSDTFGA